MPHQSKRKYIDTWSPLNQRATGTSRDQRRLLDIVLRKNRTVKAISNVTAQPARCFTTLQKFHKQILQKKIVCLIAVRIVERQTEQLIFGRAKASCQNLLVSLSITDASLSRPWADISKEHANLPAYETITALF